MQARPLQKILYQHYLSASLLPVFVVELLLLLLYFSIITLITTATTDTLLEKARQDTHEIAIREAQKLNLEFREVSTLARFIQMEQQQFFLAPQAYGLPNGRPLFDIAENGVFFKFNDNSGASLYYSSQTEINDKAYEKALKTEAFDPLLKNIVTHNPHAISAYFNSYDNMNRIYPFINNVAEQLGAHMTMQDFNFYYEADAEHNPARQPVWTDAYLDPTGQGWMVSCIVPIYSGSFLEGVSGIDVTIKQFSENILTLDLPWQGSAFLLNEEGAILAMPESIEHYFGLQELKHHIHDATLTETIKKPENFNLTKNKDSNIANKIKHILETKKDVNDFQLKQRDFLLIQEVIEETGWRLFVLIEKKQIYASVYELEQFAKRIGYGMIIFMILFYLVFFSYLIQKSHRVSAQIATPITELANVTSHFHEQLKQVQLPFSKSYILEVKQLTDNFNQMILELQELFNHLELKVQSRTQQIEQKNQDLVLLNQEKNEFLGIAAHDLKNPLQAIQGSAQLIEITLEDEGFATKSEVIEFAYMINLSAERMFELITNLLDVNAIESGKITLNLREVDILPILQKVVTEYTRKALLKNIIVHFEPQLTCYTTYVDINTLHQVLDNLISNAVKYSPLNKNIHIHIFHQSTRIRIEIQDQGQGLSPEDQTKLFGKFTRLTAKPTGDEHSTGLGLFIVKKLVTALNGQVWCESEQGQGATFILTLPMTKIID
ncbi:ATP-binding protein [Candidatus Albibeggiatoa sp. nov. BB20]|uniref:ATP-binding protein n=1 Tax=Candidatus Albibeggiatoa sp. nov. BB20 TaxID=3162723 RepID=UPI003365A11F